MVSILHYVGHSASNLASGKILSLAPPGSVRVSASRECRNFPGSIAIPAIPASV